MRAVAGTNSRRSTVAPRPERDWRRNLSRRLPAPAKGNGRLQVQVRRAFLIHGPVVSATTIYDLAYPRRPRRYYPVYRVLREIAVQVGRAPRIGRPRLWRLRIGDDSSEKK